MDQTATHPKMGLLAGLAGLAKNGAGLLLSRLELAALEWSELRGQLLKLAVVLVFAIMTAWFALAYSTVWVVYVSWDSLGWKILPILALCFLALSGGLLWYACAMLKQGRLSLPLTMAELKTDRALLLQACHPHNQTGDTQ